MAGLKKGSGARGAGYLHIRSWVCNPSARIRWGQRQGQWGMVDYGCYCWGCNTAVQYDETCCKKACAWTVHPEGRCR